MKERRKKGERGRQGENHREENRKMLKLLKYYKETSNVPYPLSPSLVCNWVIKSLLTIKEPQKQAGILP